MEISLTISTSIMQRPVVETVNVVRRREFVSWSRTTRLNGGSWEGTLVLEGDYFTILNWFNNWIFLDVKESFSGVVYWRGFINSLEFEYKGSMISRTMDEMYNYVRFKYTNEANEVIDATPISDTDSSADFGRREILLTGDNFLEGEATAYATRFLEEHKRPITKPISLLSSSRTDTSNPKARLSITVLGYIHTFNWRYVTAGDGTETDLSDWIDAIVGTDCEFDVTRYIQENTLQTMKQATTPTLAWDAIMQQVDKGDATGRIYYATLTTGLRFVYELIGGTPHYNWYDGVLYSGEYATTWTNPWAIRPGIVKHAPALELINLPPTDSYLGDVRNMLVEEVEVDHLGNFALNSISYYESDAFASRLRDKDRDKETDKDKERQRIFYFGFHYVEWGRLNAEFKQAWMKKWRDMSQAQRNQFKEERYQYFSRKRKGLRPLWKAGYKKPLPKV